MKQLTIHKAPYVLTVHLKRFHFYNLGQKINKNVNFDSTLDLKPFVSGPHVSVISGILAFIHLPDDLLLLFILAQKSPWWSC